MKDSDFAKELYKRYGAVTRSRGCFLYTKKNVRIIDMYQQNGRAILGWDAGNAFTFFKNFLTKGLCGNYICEDSSRVEKAVSSLLSSERKIFYFSTKEQIQKTSEKLKLSNIKFYMPWDSQNTDWANEKAVIIVPPFPWTDTLFILAIQKDLISENDICENSAAIPFALETGIARAIYNLISEIPNRQEKDWFIYDTILTKYWERKGPYLYSKIPSEKYDNFVLHCLDLGIAINPDYNSPSIIPYGADKGNFTKLKNSPFAF